MPRRYGLPHFRARSLALPVRHVSSNFRLTPRWTFHRPTAAIATPAMPTSHVPAAHESTAAAVRCAFAFRAAPPPAPATIRAAEQLRPPQDPPRPTRPARLA